MTTPIALPVAGEMAVYKSLGACSPRKIFKFRPYESASEAVGDHHNHTKCDNWTVTLVIHCMVRFLGTPFPSESAFECESLPQNCPTELQIRVFYVCRT